MTPVSVRECTRLEDVGEPDEWDALRARAPASTCGSRKWLAAAFGTTHSNATPFLLVAEAHGRLVGLLPLALHDQSTFPTVRFAGAPHNDLNDLLVLPEREQEAAAAIVGALSGLAGRGWSVSLDDVDPDGHLAAAADRNILEWAPGGTAPTVDLRTVWSSAASGRRRRQWNRRLRRLRDDHVVEFRRIDGPAMTRELPEFVRLREARRQATGRPPDQPPAVFFEAVVHALAPAGTCAFMEMLVDGCPVASDLYLLDPPVATMWLRGLDPEVHRYPCGHLLLRESAATFAANGYDTLDLGRGDEPYKFVFGAERRVLLRARLRWDLFRGEAIPGA